jgi:mRNA-degrading endonuclease RelE of RelBE toxin-antitoxin system
MAVFIHREARFNRRLDVLKRGDKKSSMAAERARELIKKLFEEDLEFLEETYNRTKHGELRIDKCRKYDLGSGYRLICVEQGGGLVIAYVGAHDDCDRWIENNRRFEPELSEIREDNLLSEGEEDGNEPSDSEYDEDMDYDDILMKQIDDNLLREIFCGLCREET